MKNKGKTTKPTKMKNRNPQKTRNLLSKLFLTWIGPYIKLSEQQIWEQEMHFELLEEDKIDSIVPRFESLFKNTGSLLKTTILYKWCQIAEFVPAQLLLVFLRFHTSLMLRDVVEKLQKTPKIISNRSKNSISLNLVGIAFISLFNTIIERYYTFRVQHLSYKVRSAGIALVTSKLLKSKLAALKTRKERESGAEGYFMNLIQLDLARTQEFLSIFLSVVELAATIITGLTYAYILVGKGGALLVLVPILAGNLVAAGTNLVRSRLLKRLLEAKDARLCYLKSVLKSVEHVKLNALENFFCFKIFQKREKEIKKLQQLSWVEAFEDLVGVVILGAAKASILVYFLKFRGNGKFEFSKFTGFLQVFDILSGSFLDFNVYVNLLVEAKISMNRIEAFLKSDEDSEVFGQIKSGFQKEIVIRVRDGAFAWDKTVLEGFERKKRKRDGGGLLTRPGVTSTEGEGLFGKESDRVAFLASRSLKKEEKSFFLEKEVGEVVKQNFGFLLRNINLEIKKGEKVMVVGKSGSGKTSLLYSLLEELIKHPKSKIGKIGSVAFLNQNRWTMGDTVRNNILLGSKEDPSLLKSALKLSIVDEDLKLMKEGKGLDTDLGDTGNTISCGQRLRIALARCFYQRPEIYLMDDPFSCLHAEIANQILKTITKSKALKPKTFIICTNSPEHLKQADRILYLENGRIMFNGKYKMFKKSTEMEDYLSSLSELSEESEQEKDSSLDIKFPEEDPTDRYRTVQLITHPKSNLRRLKKGKNCPKLNQKTTRKHTPKRERIMSIHSRSHLDSFIASEASQNQLYTSKRTNKIHQISKNPTFVHNLYIKEQRRTGKVKTSVFLRMVHTFGGWGSTLIVTLLTLVLVLLESLNIFLTTGWAQAMKIGSKTTENSVYFLLGITAIAAALSAARTVICLGIRASRVMHAKMVFQLLHASVTHYFERTDFGQLVNRFSLDISILDRRVFTLMGGILLAFFKVAVSIASIVIGAKNLSLLAPCCLFFLVGAWYRGRYMRAKREIERLFCITMSPICGWTETILKGLVVLRASRKEGYCLERMKGYIEENTKNGIVGAGLKVWFGQRLALWSWLLVVLPAYSYVAYLIRFTDFELEYSFFVLFVISSNGLSKGYQTFINVYSELENSLISVERCKEFEEIPPEPGYGSLEADRGVYERPKNSKKFDGSGKKRRLEGSLFKLGGVRIRDLTAQYPSRAEAVLKGVNLVVRPGEKIGVRGRMGAGKSSLTKLFTRVLEAEEGRIEIDGVDLGEVDLKVLRENITILTQKNYLFEGTLLENIDPYLENKTEIQKIEKLLKTLKFDNPEFQEKGLAMKLITRGENLSQGERQVISFVRAVHTKKKVVIFDQAFSRVSLGTKKLFKKVIDQEFKDCTMLVIFHRLESLFDYNKFVVLDRGELVSYSPTPSTSMSKLSNLLGFGRLGSKLISLDGCETGSKSA